MLRRYEFWLLTILAVVIAAFAIGNMLLFQTNRSNQTEVTNRQQFIQQSIQLQGLYTEMIKALADLSIRNQDAELGNLLGSQGISISVTPNAPAPAPAPKGMDATKKGAQ